MKKGVARLIFLVVFLVPITWYLFLQLFGNNSFVLGLLAPVKDTCGAFDELVIVSKIDSISIVKKNYLNRISFLLEKKSIKLLKEDERFFHCINQKEAELVMVDKVGLWGSYELSREGIDRLLTELDILLLQKSYGKDTTRQ